MKTLGLDEAGRGCVLGPLVVGAYCVEDADIPKVKTAGATDSKRLSAKKRDSLIEPLGALGEHRLIEITPAEIDLGNLNDLELAAFVDHILHFRPERVVIDAPVHPNGIPNFTAKLLAALDYVPVLVIENKADLNYPSCGAASIFAKVRRDSHIAPLNAGSGYPSDPVTRDWLMGFIERKEPFPSTVRTRWGTIAKLQQQSLF
jgi:ribonuclease HII